MKTISLASRLLWTLCCFGGGLLRPSRAQSVPSWTYWDEVRLAHLVTTDANVSDAVGVDGGNRPDAPLTPLLPVQLQQEDGSFVAHRIVHLASFLPFLAGTRVSSYDEAAAVLLAIYHWNHPATSPIPLPTACNIRLTTAFYDTRLDPIHTTTLLSNILRDRQAFPAAIVGAFRSAVTSPLAVLASVHDLPVISPASTSADLEDVEVYPTVARTAPSSVQEAAALADFLHTVWKVPRVAMLYVADAFGAALAREFQEYAAGLGMDVTAVPFSARRPETSIPAAVQRLADLQYRYTVCITFPHTYEDIMTVAHAAGLVTGNHVWLFYGLDETTFQGQTSEAAWAVDSVLAQATAGIGILQLTTNRQTQVRQPGDGAYGEFPDPPVSVQDKIRQEWSTTLQSRDFQDYFSSKLPTSVVQRLPHARGPQSDWTYFVYDAVVSLGMTMCRVTEPYLFTAVDLMPQFVNLSYSGATGNVAFTATQTRASAQFTLWNVLPVAANATTGGFSLTPTAHYNEGAWTVLRSFVFRNGQSTPPAALAPANVNLDVLDDVPFIFGAVVATVIVGFGLYCLLWTWRHRASPVVCAAQPLFLQLVAIGIIVQGMSLLPPTFFKWADWGYDDRACNATQWLYFAGFSITCGALYAKTWRLYKNVIYPEVDRLVVTVWDFVLWVGVLLAAHLGVLMVWNITDPQKYVMVYDSSTDVFGRPVSASFSCRMEEGENGRFFWLALVLLDLLALLVVVYWAVRCRSIETEYSESRYICFTLGTILEGKAIGAPMYLLSRDTPDVQYCVWVGMILLTALVALLLVFVPKFGALKEDVLRSQQSTTETNASPAEAGSRISHHPSADSEFEYDQAGRVLSSSRHILASAASSDSKRSCRMTPRT